MANDSDDVRANGSSWRQSKSTSSTRHAQESEEKELAGRVLTSHAGNRAENKTQAQGEAARQRDRSRTMVASTSVQSEQGL